MEVDGPLARRLVPEPIVPVGRQREPRHSPDQSLQDQARIDCCYPTSTSEKHDIMPLLYTSFSYDGADCFSLRHAAYLQSV